MPEMDAENTRQLVQHFRAEAATYRRQWTLSLGIGCGGAAIAMISLAANLPNPDFAFRLFAPSLWIFLVGITAAAVSLPVAAFRSESIGVHFSEAFNREQAHAAARQIPEVFSSPKSMAERMNAPRDAFIKQGNQAHDLAENAWRNRDRCNVALVILLAVSAIAFVLGVSLPLIHISRGGALAPPSVPSQSPTPTPTLDKAPPSPQANR